MKYLYRATQVLIFAFPVAGATVAALHPAVTYRGSSVNYDSTVWLNGLTVIGLAFTVLYAGSAYLKQREDLEYQSGRDAAELERRRHAWSLAAIFEIDTLVPEVRQHLKPPNVEHQPSITFCPG